MIFLIKLWREQFLYGKFMFRIARKQRLGRTYSLRDAPDWFIKCAADDEPKEGPDDDLDRAYNVIIAEARNELNARRIDARRGHECCESTSTGLWTVTLKDEWNEWITGIFLFIRVMFRHAMGRWYYFRDEPDWFVESIAIMEHAEGEQDDDDKEWNAIIQEARNEIARRESRHKRENERQAFNVDV